MKRISFAIALIIFFSGNLMIAQKLEVNTSKSSIKWVGKKIGGYHEGYIQLKSGNFEITGDKIVSGSFTIDMTTITNTDLAEAGYDQKLVDHLESDDFFGVEKYPTAIFRITNSTKFDNGISTVTGDLTIKDKTETVTFEVIKGENNYKAKLEIDRSKFDVKYGSNSFFDNLGDKAIDDIFTLYINLIVN